MNSVIIAGFGSYIPARRISNQDWERLVDTTDEWIRKNIGIGERSRIGVDETTADMGHAAAKIALEQAALPADRLDFVICATNSQDDNFPATASKIQDLLGVKNATAFDLQAGCTGWLYGMRLATGLLQSGQAGNVLVVGTDALSRALNFHDRSTTLFGDGSGAAVLCTGPPADSPADDAQSKRLPAPLFFTHCEPSYAMRQPSIYREELNRMEDFQDGKDMSTVERPIPSMQGKVSMKLALQNTRRAMDEVLRMARERGLERFDVFVPHQTNIHIIKALCEHAGVDFADIPYTLEKYGGISTAGIPTGIYEHHRAGKIKPGDLILTCGYGAGFTTGAMLFEWSGATGK